jgi:hypothetical protein
MPRYSPPLAKPFAVRALNHVGGALRAVGLPLVRLDAATLMAQAERATGLGDYGDDRFREPLACLIAALESEARMTFLGRMIAQRDLVRLLENRLQMQRVFAEHPEITRGEIRRPLFILGLPRTGTTILHELMAQDPANRVPMSWEAHRPFPPPERATYETDPRIAEIDAHFAQVDRILPGFKRMHAMGARLPQECVALTAHEFATMIYHTTHDVPSYQGWLEANDLRWVYASHRRQLQYLQWHCPAERWVLKSPAHLWFLDTLLAEYPDACIVQTHRDPLKVVASLCSLVTLLRSMASDDIDPPALAADWTVRLAAALQQSLDARRRGALPPERVFDIHLSEFVGNEIAVIRRLYEHLGWTFSAEADRRMRAYLATHPRDRHGAHRYRLADSGLDLAHERRRYADYQDYFRIAAEKED